MRIIKGGITAPKGFLASGIAAGIKRKGLDLGLLYSKEKAVCAGVFTANKVKAAPVLISILRIKNLFHRAVIINSGCANCLTGKKGISASEIVAKKTAKILKVKEAEVLPCSTGVIGKMLDSGKIISNLPLLVKSLSRKGSQKFAKAITTTDTFIKEFACSFKVGSSEVRIGGVAKGAGMIAPDMATTICVIATDAGIGKSTLKLAVKTAVGQSFNCITVDGDMSTNDTLLCFANGSSGIKIKPNTDAHKKFTEALNLVSVSLAKMVVKDGEGATKFVDIQIIGAKTYMQARKTALAIANSNLVKTAIYGQSPNIGRIASACGASDSGVIQEKLDIYFGGKRAVKGGVVCNCKGLRGIFKKKNIQIKCNLNLGKACCRVFTSDLSPEYVKINAEYS